MQNSHHPAGAAQNKIASMKGEALVKLLEEMIDLKFQKYTERHINPNPEVAKLLEQKHATDNRHMEQIRSELVRLLA